MGGLRPIGAEMGKESINGRIQLITARHRDTEAHNCQRRCSRIVQGQSVVEKWSLFYSINESVSYLFISAVEPACSACATTTSACCSTCVVCRFVNGRNVRQMGGWLIDGPMVGPRND